MVKIKGKHRRGRKEKVLGSPVMKYFMFLIVILTSISMISAVSWDNVKQFDKDVGKYGKVTIKNSVLGIPFLQLDKVIELELKENSDICEGYECYAKKEIVIYERGTLIEDIRFLHIERGGNTYYDNIYYKIYIKRNNKWEIYNLGEEVNKGTYEVKLEGQIPDMFTTVDWQIKSNGYWLEEWAEWSSSLNKKLLAYWNMTNTTDTIIPDHTGNGFDGTIIGSLEPSQIPHQVPGIVGNAQTSDLWNSFNYINVSKKGLQDLNTSFSINLWVKQLTVNSSATAAIFALGGSGSFAIGISGDNATFTQTGVSDFAPKGRVNLTNGSWHMITAVVQSNGSIMLYEDGIHTVNMSDAGGLPRNFDGTQHTTIGIAFNLPKAQNQSLDEIGVWNKTLTDAEITQLFNSGSGISHIPSGVALISPKDNNNTIERSIIFSGNITSPSNNLQNATLYLWDSDNVATTNFTAISGSNFIVNQSLSDLSLGTYTWNYFACSDSSTLICDWSENNFTLEVSNFFETAQTFNNITTEGATETFSINFTKGSDVQVSTVNLIYNGTVNSFPYSVNGDEVFSQDSIIIPAVGAATNLNFHWNVIFNDETSGNTTSQNQSVLIIGIDNCSSFTNLVYNFTHLDEDDKTVLGNNKTIELEVNMYDSSKSLLLVNFSQKFINTNPVQVCLEDSLLPTVNYSSYVTVKYFANLTTTNQTYSIEYHNILNQTISNTTIPKNVPLYNLKGSETTKFRLTFRDGSYTLAPNILVNVFRKYVEDNDFKLVEIPLTDSNGQTMLNLVKNDIIYNFVMTNEGGEIIATFNSVTAFCQDFTIGECTIILSAESTSEASYDYNEEFELSITQPTYDNSTEAVSISFVTNDLTPKTVKMEVFRNNQFGNRSVCTNSLTAASGTLSCDVSSITDTDQFLFVHIFVDGDLSDIYTINLNAETLNFGKSNGAFYAFLLMLFMITLFMEDRKILVISLGLGWVVCLSLGLLKGTLVGATSSGIWVLVTIAIYIWKLNKEDGI